MPGNYCEIAGWCCLGLLPKSSFLTSQYEQLLSLDLVMFAVGVNGSESSWDRHLSVTPLAAHLHRYPKMLLVLYSDHSLTALKFCRILHFLLQWTPHHEKIYIQRGLWLSAEADIVSPSRCGCFPDWIGVSLALNTSLLFLLLECHVLKLFSMAHLIEILPKMGLCH